MKANLLTLAIILIFNTAFSQALDVNHPAVSKLQNKYNEAIKIAMNKENLPWASAIVIGDATVNHILDADFNAAERHMRSLDKQSSMSQIDSTIQFTIVFNAFVTSAELANVKINNPSVVIKALQEGRRKTRFPRIAMGMDAINTGSSIQLASHLMKNQIEELNIFFDHESTFRAAQVNLAKLGVLLGKSGAKFHSERGIGQNSDKLICRFFNQSGDLAQFKLAYEPNDYFGKIQSIEFIDKRDFQKDTDGPPPPVVELIKN